jgi:hypothetical protein
MGSMSTPKGTRPWNYGTSKGWIDKRGYRWIYVTEGGKRRARREHRAVMEAHLGRKLEPWELVHHRDENKLNNDLSNLEIREFGEHTIEHHAGSRRDEDARRSIEAFARMREALKVERAIKAELYEALETICRAMGADPQVDHQIWKDAFTALAKARGEA